MCSKHVNMFSFLTLGCFAHVFCMLDMKIKRGLTRVLYTISMGLTDSLKTAKPLTVRRINCQIPTVNCKKR